MRNELKDILESADFMELFGNEVDKEMEKRKMKSKMLLQVHDELVFDMHQEEAVTLRSLVKDKMEQAISLQVPLIVDIGEGDNWLKAH